jgi:hypothetical protein
MADLPEQDPLVFDPLSPVTRAERRTLLGLSALGIAMAKVPLVPTKLAFFGLDFAPSSQAMLLHMMALIIGFFMLAFLVYAASDLVSWFRNWSLRTRARDRAEAMADLSMSEADREALKISRLRANRTVYFDEQLDSLIGKSIGGPAIRATGLSAGVLALRMAFELLVPMLVSGYAFSSLAYFASSLKP